MISYKMAQVLMSVPYVDLDGVYKDGRTLRALQTRGLIKAVKWLQRQNTYSFKLTKSGVAMSRNLRFNRKAELKEMLK